MEMVLLRRRLRKGYAEANKDTQWLQLPWRILPFLSVSFAQPVLINTSR